MESWFARILATSQSPGVLKLLGLFTVVTGAPAALVTFAPINAATDTVVKIFDKFTCFAMIYLALITNLDKY
jgi:hypothetical protein